jgi:hypothetical protein
VITGDEVDALLFDVLGTVVDEAGSTRAELACPPISGFTVNGEKI